MINMKLRTSLTIMLLAFLAFFFLALATTNPTFKVFKPWEARLIVETSNVNVTRILFGYDSATNRYINASVTIFNSDTQPATATVSLLLYTEQNRTAAQGEKTAYNIPPSQSVTVTIPLTWHENYTASDVAGGKLIVVQQPKEAA